MTIELELRDCGFENVEKLYWIKGDTGAWSGPLDDWNEGIEDFLSHVSNFGTVVQAGGCCGMYPRFYKNHFNKVITFEPNKDNYICLSKNCENTDIVHYNKALGSEITTATMSYARPGGDNMNVGMHRVNESVPGEIEVTTVDSLKLKSLDLLHLDLEGSEEDALMGAIQTITRYWPVIITERANGDSLLKLLGYECVKTMRMDSIFVKKFW